MSLMLDEIRQQPAVLERTLRSALPNVRKLKTRLETRRPRMVLMAARGTSDNAALFGRYLLEVTTGIPVSLAAPSIQTLYNAEVDLRDALVIGVSQSGESTDTNLVIERAKAQGAATAGIVNEADSSLARLADEVFHVRAGREKSVAATKTYTGQLMMLYLMAYALGGAISLDQLERIPEWAHKALSLEKEIRAKVQRYRFMDYAVVVGRGLNYANAFEFALKMMETCYVVAERFSSADFLHGPIAIVERNFPCFLFAAAGVTKPGVMETAKRLQELQAEMLLITDRANRDAAALGPALVIPANLSVKGARHPDLYSAIPYIIPAQLFTEGLAQVKGLNPDQPRGLRKVTLTL